MCWEHDDNDEGKMYRFHSEKDFLESPCFWGKRLKEIVSELTILGYEDESRTIACMDIVGRWLFYHFRFLSQAKV